jgi:hypothetical protein
MGGDAKILSKLETVPAPSWHLRRILTLLALIAEVVNAVYV